MDDPRYRSDMDRFREVDSIHEALNGWFNERKADEAIETLQSARVPCARLNTVDKLLTDPQVKARENVAFMNYPGLGEMPIPNFPIKLSLTPGSLKTPSPGLAEHNEDVYRGLLGFSQDKLSRLKSEKVI